MTILIIDPTNYYYGKVFNVHSTILFGKYPMWYVKDNIDWYWDGEFEEGKTYIEVSEDRVNKIKSFI